MNHLLLSILMLTLTLVSYGQPICVDVVDAQGSGTGEISVTINTPIDPDNPPPYEIYIGNQFCTLTSQDIQNGTTTCTADEFDPGEEVCIEVYSGENCGIAETCIIVTGSNCSDMPANIFAPGVIDPICPNSQAGEIQTALLDIDPCLDGSQLEVSWYDDNSTSFSRSGLNPGTYCVKMSVKSTANCGVGCFVVRCFEIPEVETTPLEVEANITPTHICCDEWVCRLIPGSIDLNITGGSGNYTIEPLGLNAWESLDKISYFTDRVCVIVRDDCGQTHYECFDMPPPTGGPECRCEPISKDNPCGPFIFGKFRDPITEEEYTFDPVLWDNEVFSNYEESELIYQDEEWRFVRNYKATEGQVVYDLYKQGNDMHIYMRSIYDPSQNNYSSSRREGLNLKEMNPISDINSSSTDSEIKLYTNPTSSEVVLELSVASETSSEYLTIYDVTGRVVHSRLLMIVKGHNKFVVNTSNIGDGVYFLRVGNRKVQRLVKSSN